MISPFCIPDLSQGFALLFKIPWTVIEISIPKENGLLTIATAGNVLRIVPPIIISKNEINQSLSCIEEVCDELDSDMLAYLNKN